MNPYNQEPKALDNVGDTHHIPVWFRLRGNPLLLFQNFLIATQIIILSHASGRG